MTIEQNYNIGFIAKMALREKQIQQNYRPLIAVHKWFARRPGTLFRGLLLSEFNPQPVEQCYLKSNCFPGLEIADPFMGGGTPLLEANRLGCNVIGVDINPMAAWIVREEIDTLDLTAYTKAAAELISHLGKQIGDLYQTRCAVTGREGVAVKYYMWVKTGVCSACRLSFDLFPSYLLAEDARHPKHVLICHACGDLNEVTDPKLPGSCGCGAVLRTDGPVKRNKCACPHCGVLNSAPFHGNGPPAHRLFAMEYHNPDLRYRPGRLFKKPDADDLARLEAVADAWKRTLPSFVPDDAIPIGDESSRLHRWGYKRFSELFNDRQLLALETSARYIAGIGDERIRRALATNFSDLLRYQNLLCRYDTMALKSLDIFSIHGFPVSYVQVESNFLGIRNARGSPVGSGGWVNIIDKYSKAKRYCTDPFEITHDGASKTTHYIAGEWIGERHPTQPQALARTVDIRCMSSTEVALAHGSLDGVFTDPPYFGMVQYGELMQFCYVWLRKLMGRAYPGLELTTTRHANELTGNNTAERNIEHFAEGLAAVYKRMAAALKPGAPLVFTFHHNQQLAYLAAAMGILDAGLTCTASLPCPAEMGGSIHIHGTASSIVDTVFVCRQTGTTKRSWLFESADGLAQLMSGELAELRAAGMKPSAGDIRCIAFGHITRMAIWSLRPEWPTARTTPEKLARIRTAMDKLATVDAVQARLTAPRIAAPTFRRTAVNKTREWSDADAV